MPDSDFWLTLITKLRLEPNEASKPKTGRCVDIGKNYYRILQVSEDADLQVISAAYRALAKRHHPDVVGPLGADYMTLLNEAHSVLTNPALRATYDKQRDHSKDLKEDTPDNNNERFAKVATP
ncbi:J domain-containing protein [Rhodoblastus sp.]|uniref:J domain-containing protein n=1 Tax=Rhodoblastus sp. TaxID=1962975 RepID=UPI003F94A734